jgi:hypothetical protein
MESEALVDNMLGKYEQGKVSRRQFIEAMSMLAGTEGGGPGCMGGRSGSADHTGEREPHRDRGQQPEALEGLVHPGSEAEAGAGD